MNKLEGLFKSSICYGAIKAFKEIKEALESGYTIKDLKETILLRIGVYENEIKNIDIMLGIDNNNQNT